MTHPYDGLPDHEPVPETALVVFAHPDDVDFGASGTIACLTDAGSRVTYCVVTDGDAGEAGETPREKVAELRQTEQRAAAAAVGVDDLRFLGWPDGAVVEGLDLRRDIARAIRLVKPELVITQNPERNLDRIYGSHPDHRAVASATIDAVYPDARNPWAHPELDDEGHRPHAVPRLWLMGGPDPDLTVDITTAFDAKVAALTAHRSQTGRWTDLRSSIGEWAERAGRQAGLADGRKAERFRTIDTK
ncbi:MAG: PIG-L family deacetylase [Actinomycetia bacterium]|nr:PIG-L family deacetylase [Actinomycetes bacterium]